MTWILILLFAWPFLAIGLSLAWRRRLLALWREPMFKVPILIVESDDWGSGPPEQAEALAKLAACLSRHRDSSGRPAVMTLALVLAVPEPILRQSDPWLWRTLADPAMQPILAAIQAGRNEDIFAPQLHGLAHFWPDAVLAAAHKQPEVRAWLAAPDLTEHLPSPLQSRWTDTSVLPSRPHSRQAVADAVAEEIGQYTALLGYAPEAVVPPTFVWNRDVEAAWAELGIQVVITPGRRPTGRDGAGRPAGVDRHMLNGERGEGGVFYLVRDDYFEPAFGHRPEQALAALARKTALGRPCLLETHRSNFLSATCTDPASAFAALDTLYRQALRDYPTLRFASCVELGRAMRGNDPAWIEHDRRRRFTIWLRRVSALPRFGKAARLTGLLPLLNLFTRSDLRP